MSNAILLDTDVIVDYLRGRKDAVAYVKANAKRIALSSIVVAELCAGVKGDEELQRLDDFVSLFPVIAVTVAVARRAGLVRRDYLKSHGVGLADAVLAATAEEQGAELTTLNTRHYPMLRGLRPPYIKP